MTARQFLPVLERVAALRRTRERRADFRAGLVASIMYNAHRRRGAAGLGPTDFFPALEDELPEDLGTVEDYLALVPPALVSRDDGDA